jgi:uncharacterized membrane protein YccC
VQSKQIRITRIILAYFISFVYIYAVNISEGIWVFMTCALVLMDNTTVGGTFNKGSRRFKGTFFAFLFSLVWIQLFANSDIANLIGLAVGVFIAGIYFLDTKDMYTGGVMTWTLPLLLINNNDLHGLFVRVLNIGVGVLIVFLVQRFFYPDYARTNVLKNMSGFLNKIKALLDEFGKPEQIDVHTLSSHYLKFEEQVASDMSKFYQCLTDARRETQKNPMYVEQCHNMFLGVRRLNRVLYLIVALFNNQEARSDQKTQLELHTIYNKLEEAQSLLDAHEIKTPLNSSILKQPDLRVDTFLLQPDSAMDLYHLLDLFNTELNAVKIHLEKILLIGKQERYF